jgi:hypothetical protein
MATIYLKKPGEKETREIKNVTPNAVEDDLFYYTNQYDTLCGARTFNLAYIITDTKPDAIRIADMCKHTGQYIAVIQVKHDYYIWFGFVDALICPKGRAIREWNNTLKK